MKKIFLMSDVHLEFAGKKIEVPESDVLVVLAGDIGIGLEGLAWAKKNFEKNEVVYVFGNHEFYGQRTISHLIKKAKDKYENDSFHILDKEWIEKEDFILFGATLWTDFALLGDTEKAMSYSAKMMNDYKKIFIARRGPLMWSMAPYGVMESYRQGVRWSPLKAKSEHEDTMTSLENAGSIARASGKKLIVVSHHAPHPESLNKDEDEQIMPTYASDLTKIMTRLDVRLWMHGHTHKKADYNVGGTRVVSNPRGYKEKNKPCFFEGMMIEI